MKYSLIPVLRPVAVAGLACWLLAAAPALAQLQVDDAIAAEIVQSIGLDKKVTVERIEAIHVGGKPVAGVRSGRVVLTMGNASNRALALRAGTLTVSLSRPGREPEELGEVVFKEIELPAAVAENTPTLRTFVLEFRTKRPLGELASLLEPHLATDTKDDKTTAKEPLLEMVLTLKGKTDLVLAANDSLKLIRRGVGLTLACPLRLAEPFELKLWRDASKLSAPGELASPVAPPVAAPK